MELFRKFNDKTEPELNFKKLLMKKCHKEFYKDRMSDDEGDFSKGMLLVFHQEEIEYKKKQKIIGNIKLIGELFCRGHVMDKVIVECFDFLFSETSDQNVESLCHFLSKIVEF